MPSEAEFEAARAQFPVLERIAYLNAGSMGPLSRATVDGLRAELDRELGGGRSGGEYIDRVLELRAELRRRLAALVAAEPEQVALTSSTTDGCNVVLAGLDLGPGDEIVTTTDEHFGLIGPLHTSGARVLAVAPDPDLIVAAVSPRTRLRAGTRRAYPPPPAADRGSGVMTPRSPGLRELFPHRSDRGR